MTKYKNENLDLLMTPKVFYCTFHHEYAYHLAIKLSKKMQIEFLGKQINIKDATEPTDIIWENRHYRKLHRTCRWMCARFFMIIFALIGFLLIIILLKNKLAVQYVTDPPGIACDNVRNQYGDNYAQVAYREQLEWLKYKDADGYDLDRVTTRRGALLCFCNEIKSSKEKSLVRLADGTEDYYEICKSFKDETELVSFAGFLSNGTSFLVVLISFILRKVFISLVQCAGFNKNSQEATATMSWVLIVSFFNYGVLYIIAPWNLRAIVNENYTSDSDLFTGIYTDFTHQWFNDIGSLVATTTATNIVFPLIEFAGFLLIRVVKRCVDQKTVCPTNKYNTNAKTMPKFEELYSGPLFFVHYRLAFIVNIVWITFLFGPGMPILFLIALAGLIFTYVSERLRMAYSYTKPPMYDSRLTAHTLYYLRYAPIMYAVYGIWLFSNQQVFRNTVSPIVNFNLYPI